MTLIASGSAGGRPALADLAQLAALLGAPGGLIGSGYRTYMAQAGSPPLSGAVGVQHAANDASCPTCHQSVPPSPLMAPPRSAGDLGAAMRQLPEMINPTLLPLPLAQAWAMGQFGRGIAKTQIAPRVPTLGPTAPTKAGRRRREWSDDPRCDEQFRADRAICQGLPEWDESGRESCWRAQNERNANCTTKGILDFPPLLGWR
jgi:hypothetical protein